MAFHEFKGWEPGPEDATHFSVQDVGTPWLKVDNEGVYFAAFFPSQFWYWRKYLLHEQQAAEKHLVDAIAKHPAVEPLGIEVIHGVEVNWKEAPEGTTHVVILRGEFHGWRKRTPEIVYRWVINGWADGGAVPHVWLDVNKHCIFEHPNIRGDNPQAPAAKQEAPKPAPKKQVGWWS